MGALEPGHLLLIIIIALIVFGPGKAAELGGTLGRGVRDFRDAMDGKSPQPRSLTPAEARTCETCHTVLASDARFCPQCGAPVALTRSDDRPESKLN
jgi:sec-independent protein translocase protein TatA